MRRTAATAAVLALTCAACTGVPVRIDNAVPPEVDRSTGRVVEGDAYGVQLFLYIPAGVNTRHARAWEELQRNAGDAYVTNVELKEGWYYLLLGTLYHSSFRATAYPKAPPSRVAGPVSSSE
jgi:hypothetical protein